MILVVVVMFFTLYGYEAKSVFWNNPNNPTILLCMRWVWIVESCMLEDERKKKRMDVWSKLFWLIPLMSNVHRLLPGGPREVKTKTRIQGRPYNCEPVVREPRSEGPRVRLARLGLSDSKLQRSSGGTLAPTSDLRDFRCRGPKRTPVHGSFGRGVGIVVVLVVVVAFASDGSVTAAEKRVVVLFVLVVVAIRVVAVVVAVVVVALAV
jgi:hypothetical protein